MTGLYHYKTARITGEFIEINMNYFTDTIRCIELQKKPKIFSAHFQNF